MKALNITSIRVCFLIVASFLLPACGGGGGGSSDSNNATFFDGKWSGTLSGKDCLNKAVSLNVNHIIDSESEELGAVVSLSDSSGFEYEGLVQAGSQNALGFFVTLTDGSISSSVPGFIRYDNVTGGSADVSANFSISKTCVYELSGSFNKSS